MSLTLDELVVADRAELAGDGSFAELVRTRRSIRVLQDGPWTPEMADRILDLTRLAPASMNLPPWHIVLVRERREEFWATIESVFQKTQPEDRRERQLARLEGFRAGVAAALFYEDRDVHAELVSKGLGAADARTFVEQGLGIGEMLFWLALTNEGLAASLQHWHEAEAAIADFAGIPVDRFRLVATIPIGYAAETARAVERAPFDKLFSRERYTDGE